MSTAVHKIDAGEYLTIRDAADRMGCADTWVRYLIRHKRLPVKKISQRVQLVPVDAADRARESLSTRSRGKRSLAKRPAVDRKSARKPSGRRK